MDNLQQIFSKAGYKINFDAASAHATELLYINNPDGSARWVWPASLKTPLFLRFYNASGIKARFFCSLVQIIFQLGLQKWIFKSLKVRITLERVPYKAFSPEKENWALFTGTPGPNRKGIFILSDTFGQSYVKVALGESATEVIDNEALALIYLNQSKFSSFSIPQVVLRGAELVQVTGMKTGKRESKLTPMHQEALKELALVNRESQPLNKISAWKEALNKIEALQNTGDDRLPKGLIRKLKSLSRNLNWSQDVEVCFSHGDFTPWNLFVYEKTLAVYDWELSDPQRPKGFDAIHFIMQQGILVEHKSWKEIRKDLEIHTNFLLEANEFEQYLGFYLVMNTAYYLDLYSRQEKWHTQIEWLLQTWSMAISDLLQITSYMRGTLASDLVDFLRNEPYATLKFAPAFPEAISEFSDIDICLKEKTVSKIQQFLSQHPLVNRIKNNSQSFMNTIKIEMIDGSWLVLDAIWQLKWKHLEMMPIQPVLEQSLTVDSGIKKASPKNEALFTGLFYGLNGAEVPARYKNLIQHLAPARTEVEKVLMEARHPQKEFLKKALLKFSSNQSLQRLKNHFNYLFDTLLSIFKSKGFTVTFSGVDGAGKSTVIETVKNRIEKQLRMRVVVLRHRPSVLPILSAWTKGKARAESEAANTLPRQGKNSKFFPSLLRFSYYYLDYLFGQFYVYFRYISRGYVVLYDRYYFDFINDSRRSNIQLPASLTTKGYALLRKPELNLFLYANPETILSRKKELKEETITELTGKYKNLFLKLGSQRTDAKYISIENENLEATICLVMNKIQNLAA